MNSNTREELLRLADTCIALGEKPRPEVLWLQEMHERLRKKYSLSSKTETDRLIYECMYGHAPEKLSNMLKIRYWRSGRSMPSNRSHCLLLAEVLELSDSERKYMLQAWCDQCEDCFSAELLRREENGDFREKIMQENHNCFPEGFTEGKSRDLQMDFVQSDSRSFQEKIIRKDDNNCGAGFLCENSLKYQRNISQEQTYKERLDFMKVLIRHYLESVPALHLDNLKIPRERAYAYLRHIYFVDSFYYIYKKGFDRNVLLRHISSINYDSEFSRLLKLLGEIPRKTMIRHLLLFGLPELTRAELDRWLVFFGYLPLCRYHTLTTGERLDWLLIQLLELYEKECVSMQRYEKLVWFQEASRVLDAYFAEKGQDRLRLMHFKAQDL